MMLILFVQSPTLHQVFRVETEILAPQILDEGCPLAKSGFENLGCSGWVKTPLNLWDHNVLSTEASVFNDLQTES